MKFIIDVPTKQAGNNIKRRLKRLVSTISVSDPVNYFFGSVQEECQLRLESSLSEDALESWLYKSKGIDYIGITSIL